jgi:hypothetical protein
MKLEKQKIPTIEVRKKKAHKGKILTGMGATVYVNGVKIPLVTNYKLEIPSRGFAKVTLELIGDIVISEEQS